MFKFFRQLKALEDRSWMASRSHLGLLLADRYFTSDSLQDRLVRALAADRVLPIKEILECCEFFGHIRKDVRAECVADLCCGHGLLGILFALFKRDVQHVLLTDEREPLSLAAVLACATQVGPWIAGKVTFQKAKIKTMHGSLAPGTAIVSAHACGGLTDRCIDLAINLRSGLAVMPCCYPQRLCPAPLALQLALGVPLAFDVDRTYRLEHAGYHVRWTTIPPEITPMNRIMIGVPRATTTANG